MLSLILFIKFCENIFLLISPKDKNLNRNESFINPFVLFSQLFGAVSGEASCINNVSGPIQQTPRVCKMTCKFFGACNSVFDFQIFLDFSVVEVILNQQCLLKSFFNKHCSLMVFAAQAADSPKGHGLKSSDGPANFLCIPEQVPNLA